MRLIVEKWILSSLYAKNANIREEQERYDIELPIQLSSSPSSVIHDLPSEPNEPIDNNDRPNYTAANNDDDDDDDVDIKRHAINQTRIQPTLQDYSHLEPQNSTINYFKNPIENENETNYFVQNHPTTTTTTPNYHGDYSTQDIDDNSNQLKSPPFQRNYMMVEPTPPTSIIHPTNVYRRKPIGTTSTAAVRQQNYHTSSTPVHIPVHQIMNEYTPLTASIPYSHQNRVRNLVKKFDDQKIEDQEPIFTQPQQLQNRPFLVNLTDEHRSWRNFLNYLKTFRFYSNEDVARCDECVNNLEEFDKDLNNEIKLLNTKDQYVYFNGQQKLAEFLNDNLRDTLLKLSQSRLDFDRTKRSLFKYISRNPPLEAYFEDLESTYIESFEILKSNIKLKINKYENLLYNWNNLNKICTKLDSLFLTDIDDTDSIKFREHLLEINENLTILRNEFKNISTILDNDVYKNIQNQIIIYELKLRQLTQRQQNQQKMQLEQDEYEREQQLQQQSQLQQSQAQFNASHHTNVTSNYYICDLCVQRNNQNQKIMCDKCIETVNDKQTQTPKPRITANNNNNNNVNHEDLNYTTSIDESSSVNDDTPIRPNTNTSKNLRLKQKQRKNSNTNGKQFLLQAYLNNNNNNNNNNSKISTTPTTATTSVNETDNLTTTPHESGMGTFNEDEDDDDFDNFNRKINVNSPRNEYIEDVEESIQAIQACTSPIANETVQLPNKLDAFEETSKPIPAHTNGFFEIFKKFLSFLITFIVFLLIILSYYIYYLFNPVCCDFKRNYLLINIT